MLKQPRPPRLEASLVEARFLEQGLCDGDRYARSAFTGLAVAGANAESVEFEQCRFSEVTFAEARLDRLEVCDAVFASSDLANVRSHDASLTRMLALHCRMTGLSLTTSGCQEIVFDSCRMDLSSFRFSRMRNVVFRKCNLGQADFQGADLVTGVRFEDCDLTSAEFSNARMAGAAFAGCRLNGVKGVTSFRGASIQSTDLLDMAHAMAGALGIKIED